MFRRILSAMVVLTAGMLMGTTALGDDYNLDPVHSAVTFKVGHLGISWIHGRFNKVEGNFIVDGASSSFNMTIQADSVDTGVAKRDGHLRSPDFFNVKQFPVITFKSTSVTLANGGFDVSGDVTMHGQTKSINLKLLGGKTANFGGERTGFTTTFVLKRTDFGMDRLVGPAGDDVHVDLSFEGVKK